MDINITCYWVKNFGNAEAKITDKPRISRSASLTDANRKYDDAFIREDRRFKFYNVVGA